MKISLFLSQLVLALHSITFAQTNLPLPTDGPLNGYYDLTQDTVLNLDGYSSHYTIEGVTTIDGSLSENDYSLSINGNDIKQDGAVFQYSGPDQVNPDEDPMLTFTNVTLNFSNVTNETGSGGVISVTNQVVLSYCNNAIFSNNTANGAGGAVYTENSFYMQYGQNATFINNKAVGKSGNGGAIATGDMSFRLDTSDNGNISFIKNHADQKGGAIYSDATIRFLYNGNIQFINNTAGVAGGAIYSNGLVSFFANEGDIIFAGNTLADGTRQAIYQADPTANNQLIAAEGHKIVFYDGNYFAGTTTLHMNNPSGTIEFSGASVQIAGIDGPIVGAGDKAVTYFNKNLILMNGVTKISNNARLKIGGNLISYTGSVLNFDLNGISQHSSPIVTANSYIHGKEQKLTISCTGGVNTGWYNLIQFEDPTGINLDSFILEKTEESFYNWDPNTGILSLQFALGKEATAVIPTSLWTASEMMDNIFCNIMQRNCSSYSIGINNEKHSNLWVNYIGNSQNLMNQGDTLGVNSFSNGAIMGYDLQLSNKRNIGIAFAQTWGKNKYELGGISDQNLSIFSFYGDVRLWEKNQQSLSLNFMAGYGHGRNNTKLNGDHGKWSNDNFAIQSQIVYQYDVNESFSTLPYFGLQWQYLNSKQWDSNKDYHYDKVSMNFLRAQMGSYFLYNLNNSWNLCANLSLDVDVQRKNPTGTASLNGTNYNLWGSNPGRVEFNADLGINYQINQQWNSYAGYGISTSSRNVNQSFRVGASYSF